MQVAAMADYEPRMLLKTIRRCPQGVRLGATLGATRMNNLGTPVPDWTIGRDEPEVMN